MKEKGEALLMEMGLERVDEASIAPSSSVDPSAIDLPPPASVKPSAAFPGRRLFPSTGKRLSTIASVETFNTRPQEQDAASTVVSSVLSDFSDHTVQPSHASGSGPSDVESSLTRTHTVKSGLKRRLTKHSDLMSVLSLPAPDDGTQSIVSARSIRTNRSRLAKATVEDLMNELATDETNYMRELRTLVDGVIPVLLQCVLSKSDSALAAGLFGSKNKESAGVNITKPIVDMGIALERLKSTHRRIPLKDHVAFLSWSQSAQRIYADYIKAWRLGFKDVVINLAPADDAPRSKVSGSDNNSLDEGMARNDEGYVVNDDGERVDVAFLLKRPLVRLKYLAKTLKVISIYSLNTLMADQCRESTSSDHQLKLRRKPRLSKP